MEQDFQGSARRYYSIQILHNDMTVMVPVDGAEKAGIRPVIPEPMVEEVLGVLRDDPTKMPKNWNRRVKHNREKIKTGDVLEMADVVRNLALRDAREGSLHRREADVRQGQADPGLGADVRQAACARTTPSRFLDGILAEICAQQPAISGAAIHGSCDHDSVHRPW